MLFKKVALSLLLVCVVAWLVISYVPALESHMPTFAYPATWQAGLGWLGALTVLAFLAIQVWLVGSTWHSLRHNLRDGMDSDKNATPVGSRRRLNNPRAASTPADPPVDRAVDPAADNPAEQSSIRPFRLNLAGEVFWTALPILMTLAVAFAGYTIWMGL